MAYGIRRFNAALTRALQWFLSWAESTQFSALIPISSRSIIILSSHLRQGLPKGLFPVGLPVKILKAPLPFSILATCPANLNFLRLVNDKEKNMNTMKTMAENRYSLKFLFRGGFPKTSWDRMAVGRNPRGSPLRFLYVYVRNFMFIETKK